MHKKNLIPHLPPLTVLCLLCLMWLNQFRLMVWCPLAKNTENAEGRSFFSRITPPVEYTRAGIHSPAS